MLELLVAEFGGELKGESEGVDVLDVRIDSRAVQPGDLFCALPGAQADGREFIADAAARGAICVLVPEGTAPETGLPHWCHSTPRAAMGEVAARLHGQPSLEMQVVAVTGTNGKTTVAHLVTSLLESVGKATACLGTVANRVAGASLASTHTTPDAAEMQRLLALHRDAGGVAVCLEASSHALDQERLAGLSVNVAVFTNLSVDHLDYHGDLESYARTKQRLFDSLSSDSVAVVNASDPRSAQMASAAKGRGAKVMLFGEPASDLWAEEVVLGREETSFKLCSKGASLDVRTSLIGRFGVENALAAAAAAMASGLSLEEIKDGLREVAAPVGRMEPVDTADRGFTLLVDFAHTEEALAGALETLRPLVEERGRLIVVFGCGGDRDKSKREAMGVAAGEAADLVFVTSDNPRSEDPMAICRAVAEGALRGEALVTVELDRRLAIRAAIKIATPGDVILIAGKGHESSQEIAGERIPFDDRAVVAEELLG
jgi:UDP-N-acetylmuramoyl-L-alanyl-D-glutamate--2,6-diaminopimelate ligase